ncbi:MAG: hypothetical protein U0R68_05135 [Candidatus Nanopelagicales bacterium]
MALATHPAALGHGRPSLPEVRLVVRRWVVPLASMVVCAGGLAVLVPPAMRAAEPPTTGEVSVQVLGTLSTEGLPQSAAVSTLSVRNDGPAPLVWSARPTVTGAGAHAVVVETWLPGPSGCSAPTRLLTDADWSAAPLAPGASTTLCARVRATSEVDGAATPSVTVTARPA